jgi:hypothetical protein
MHLLLDKMFESSSNFEGFLLKLNAWADAELLNGRKDLPSALQR